MSFGHNPYNNLANQEIPWLPMDTEELYKENLKSRYKDLEKNNWIDNHFTYKFNSNGFRSEEFTTGPSIVFLGCSITVGIGIPYESNWATIVANSLNLKCYNLGIGGSANDTSFRFAYEWLNKIKPQICVFCQTYTDRIEVWEEQGVVANIANRYPEFYLNTWQSNDMNKTALAEKNKLAIQQLCSQDDIKFVHATVHEVDYIDLGRDLAHPGITSNKNFSNLVLSRI